VTSVNDSIEYCDHALKLLSAQVGEQLVGTNFQNLALDSSQSHTVVHCPLSDSERLPIRAYSDINSLGEFTTSTQIAVIAELWHESHKAKLIVR
jgi:hypothetical protein